MVERLEFVAQNQQAGHSLGEEELQPQVHLAPLQGMEFDGFSVEQVKTYASIVRIPSRRLPWSVVLLGVHHKLDSETQ